jgi:hypothetical protein
LQVDRISCWSAVVMLRCSSCVVGLLFVSNAAA